jgi:hypothetical protein
MPRVSRRAFVIWEPVSQATGWDIKGRHARAVNAYANAHEIADEGGIWDIWDVTTPHTPTKITGQVGAIGVRYALFYIANYGAIGHAYRVISRRDVVHGERQARSFLIRL